MIGTGVAPASYRSRCVANQIVPGQTASTATTQWPCQPRDLVVVADAGMLPAANLMPLEATD